MNATVTTLYSPLPKLVAVIGYPHAGKDTVAKILRDTFGYRRIDDGWPIRQTCMTYFNWSLEDVTTDKGKDEIVMVRGVAETRRKVMQDVGRLMEETYGEDVLPKAAIGRIEKEKLTGNFVFPSVRMKQGWIYRNAGGLVIEVTRNGCVWDGTVTENYDRSSAHASVHNMYDGSNAEEAYTTLKAEISEIVREFADTHPQAPT